ncbi:MAG: GntR family transcriptional regulator [Actinomycetota bacterium]
MTDPAVPLGSEEGTFATSPVVNSVYETILSAVHEGRLLPGERISDSALAEQLGVSRTPVREALQRLRDIGIVEASASRFTRIAMISPQQTADAMTVWLALYGAVITEVVPRSGEVVAAAMTVDHHRFLDALAGLDVQKMAEANADFFNHLVSLSRNPALQKGITSVVHQIQLGGQHLPAFIDVRALAESQAALVKAVASDDPAAALEALAMIAHIEVPLSETE